LRHVSHARANGIDIAQATEVTEVTGVRGGDLGGPIEALFCCSSDAPPPPASAS
jgi:hypothetical protein